jgi:hypothetical protein
LGKTKRSDDSIYKFLNFDKLDKGGKNNIELIEEFKLNLLKYNLSCDKTKEKATVEYHSEESYMGKNTVKGFIVTKVDSVLKNGSLQDKINLFHTISDNKKDIISSVAQIEKKVLQKGNFDNLSMCKYMFLILVFNLFFTNLKTSKDPTFQDLINKIMEKFFAFVHKTGNDDIDKPVIKVAVEELITIKKKKNAWLCAHFSRIHYARGKCRNCYLNHYHKVGFFLF